MSGVQPGSIVEDIPYDSVTWDGNLKAPSKNSIRDLIESLTVVHQSTFVRVLVLTADSRFTINHNAIATIVPGTTETNSLVGEAILEEGSILRIKSNALMTLER